MSTATHPTQVSLPGQAHIAEGPHDHTGMYLMHHAFRRDLARFEQAVRRTPVSDAATWAALERRWQRFSEVLHHHHEVEDTTHWPILEGRVAELQDPGPAQTLLRDMASEHAVIDPVLGRCAAGFRAMREDPGADARNALDVDVTAARAALLAHLEHEETGALPLIQVVATEADFAAMEEAAGRAYPSRLMPFLVPWVADGLPEEGRRWLFTMGGPVVRLVLALTRRGFARSERKAFGHV